VNRRAFIASIPLIPVAAKAAMAKPSLNEMIDQMIDGAIIFKASEGVVAYHKKFGLETDLDDVFKRIYATTRKLDGPPPVVIFRGSEREADELLAMMKRIYGTKHPIHQPA